MKKLVFISVLTICMVTVAQANVTNGGFETGDFTGWTLTNSSGRAWVVSSYKSSTWLPAEGSKFALLKTDGDNSYCTLSQSFTAAVDDSLGFKYFFDFKDYSPYDDKSYGRLFNSSGGLVQEFFNWGEDGTDLPDGADIPSTGGWQLKTYTFTAGGTYTLKFGIANDADSDNDSYMGVDAVNLTSPTIPAPGAILLGSIGVAFVGWLRRKGTL